MTMTESQEIPGWMVQGAFQGDDRISEDMAAGRGAEMNRTSPTVLSTREDASPTAAERHSPVTDATHSHPQSHGTMANLPAPPHANHSRISDGTAVMARGGRGA